MTYLPVDNQPPSSYPVLLDDQGETRVRLAGLITKRKNETGASFQSMSEAAAEAGYKLTRASIHALTRDEITEWPRPETLHGLAVALGLPVEDVLDATAESLGIEIQRGEADQPNVRAWVALTEQHPPEVVEHMLAAARAVAAAWETRDQPDSSD